MAAATEERTSVDGSGVLQNGVGGSAAVERCREGRGGEGVTTRERTEEQGRARRVPGVVALGFPSRCLLHETTPRKRRRGGGGPA
jgi:hypothetical protein